MNEILSVIPEKWRVPVGFGFILGAVGGTWLYGYSGGFAPDRFTGTQGLALAREIVKANNRIDLIESRIIALETNQKEVRSDIRSLSATLSKLPPKQLTDDVASLKAHVNHIMSDHKQVMDKIHTHR